MLDRTADLWEELRGARLFVTGGTGFVGTCLMEAFVAANRAHDLGATAVLLTRDPRRFAQRAPHLAEDQALSFVIGDAASFALPSERFDMLIHAATERIFPPDRSRPFGVIEPDLAATRRVIDLAAQRSVRRLLFTSSGAVYGASASSLERIPETYPGAPDPTDIRAAYGESKRLSEYACVAAAGAFGFEAVIARLFAFVGPHLPLDEGYAIGNFIGDVLAGRSIAIAGDGTARRSYLYAADLAIWLWTILLRGTNGRAYNVGSSHAVSILELAQTVAETLAPQTSITLGREAVAGTAPSSYVPDTTRAQQELGLEAWVELPEALRRTYTHHLESRRTTTAP